jgi:hypothetical protein
VKFTKEQVDFISRYFVPTVLDSVRVVRDGIVTKSDKVWWRMEDGPMEVVGNLGTHWKNMSNYPNVYQHDKPEGSYVGYQYKD